MRLVKLAAPVAATAALVLAIALADEPTGAAAQGVETPAPTYEIPSPTPTIIVEFHAVYRPEILQVVKRLDDKRRLLADLRCVEVRGGLGRSCSGTLAATVRGRPAGSTRFSFSPGPARPVRLRLRLSRALRQRRSVRVRLTMTIDDGAVSKTARVRRAGPAPR